MPHKPISFPVALALAIATSATLCIAATVPDLRLPHIFGNGMVLQQGKSVTVWGWAKPAAQSNDQREQLIVWSENVPNPIAVRYASSNLPVGGLMNGRELPAFPFRSDNWPIAPHQSTGSYVRMKESH